MGIHLRNACCLMALIFFWTLTINQTIKIGDIIWKNDLWMLMVGWVTSYLIYRLNI